MCASLEELQWGALFLFDHPKDANHNNVHLKGRIAVLLCALAFHCTSQRSSPLNCSNHDDLHLNGRIAVLLCALVFYCTNWRSSPLNCCSHDNMHLNGRVLFYIVHLCFTAQGEHHPHWIAAIMTMCASTHKNCSSTLCIFVSLNKSSPIELLQNERELPQKKLNGNCCLILHRNQVVITQTSLQMYCHLTCPN
jgi:hypothetical protein